MSKGYYICIGVNQIAHAASQRLSILQFAEEGAQKMKHLLDSNGAFKKSEALLGKNATRENVLQRFDGLYTKVKRSDLLVIYFCGHGRQVPASAQTSEPTSATDNFDETWVLYDDDLIDDEFQQIIASFVHRPRIVVISDSCHAGGFVPLRWRGANAVHSPVEHQLRTALASVSSTLLSSITPATVRRPLHRAPRTRGAQTEIGQDWNVICMASSLENQEAQESRRKGLALFTYHLLEEASKPAHPENYELLFQRVKENLANETGSFAPAFLTIGTKAATFSAQVPFTI